MKAAALGLLITTSGLAALAAVAAPGAKAACFSGDLIGLGTDCSKFEAGLTATAKVFFTSPNLQSPNGNLYWQLGGSVSSADPVTLTNLQWSNSQNGSYSPLLAGSLSLGTNSVASYSVIQGPTSTGNAPVPTGSPFWIQYTIPAGLVAGTSVNVQLLSNNDINLDTNGNLSNTGSNGFYSDTRTNLSAIPPDPSTDPAPGPLPLLGAGAAFGVSRRLRRRIKAAA